MTPYNRNHVISKTEVLTSAFLKRRLAKIQSNDITKFLTVNPFLLAAVAEFHQFDTVSEVAKFLFVAHMSTGHATGFGKLVDEKLLPDVFGTKKLNKALRTERKWTSVYFNEIDHIVFPDTPDWCLLSLKASAWTIQDSMAQNLYSSFSNIIDFNQQGKGIFVGVFYGHSGDLTNKYQILRGADRASEGRKVEQKQVHVLAGQEFWAWLNYGETQTQFWVLEGIRKAAAVFGQGNTRDAVAAGPAQIELQLITKYGLKKGKAINWKQFLLAVNAVTEDIIEGEPL